MSKCTFFFFLRSHSRLSLFGGVGGSERKAFGRQITLPWSPLVRVFLFLLLKPESEVH